MSSKVVTAGWRLSAHGLMLASGFAGLGYQVVWTQQSALWLGHESAAVLAVVAAFFGGLALGALTLGPRIERSTRPWRWYAGCEALIGLWGLALMGLMPPASAALQALAGAQPPPLWQGLLAFGGCFVLLLPATAAMGATLPAMEKITASLHPGQRSVAALYASNTLGAVLGVLATAFWCVPQWGLAHTALLCVGLNGLCAVLAWARVGRAGAAPAEVAHATAAHKPPLATADLLATTSAQRTLLARLAATGLLGIGYEVVVVRVLSQVTEDTVYTFAMLLAVYLVGTALGAAAYQHWLTRHRATQAVSMDPAADRIGHQLLSALCVACVLGTASLWGAERLRNSLLGGDAHGMTAAIGTEAALALMAFGLPTLVMGALFSHWSARAQAQGISLGRVLGVNTLGAALAPGLFGVWLAPWLGPKGALLLIALCYLALTARRAQASPTVWVPAVAVLALTAWAPPLAFIDVPEGGRVVSYQEGAMAAVSVVEDEQGVARLRINNRQQEGSSATRLVDGRQALLPVLLHPHPTRALFLGLGTGVTASTAAQDPSLQVQAVELLPEVIAASSHFAPHGPEAAPAPARLQVLAADARRFVRARSAPWDTDYDVIVADNFHPARSGSGSLYTVEHFQAVRSRLAAGGLFCQWLPLHQLDLATLRSIVRSFLVAYPQGSAILASNSLETPVLGLIGRAGNERFSLAQSRARLASAQFPQSLADFGIEDEFALLGSLVADPAALARFAGNAPLNTDDRPVVAYSAPRITYAPDSLPRERLVALLRELSVAPEALLASPPEAPQAVQRLGAYFNARHQFIEAGLNIRPSNSVQAMLAQVQTPLLAVLHTSPDFRPAYTPLLRMASALAATEPAASRELLQALAQAQPARPEAPALLRQLATPSP